MHECICRTFCLQDLQIMIMIEMWSGNTAWLNLVSVEKDRHRAAFGLTGATAPPLYKDSPKSYYKYCIFN